MMNLTSFIIKTSKVKLKLFKKKIIQKKLKALKQTL